MVSVSWMCSTREPGVTRGPKQMPRLRSCSRCRTPGRQGAFWVLWVGSAASCNEGTVQLETTSVLSLSCLSERAEDLHHYHGVGGAWSESFNKLSRWFVYTPLVKTTSLIQLFLFLQMKKGILERFSDWPGVLQLVLGKLGFRRAGWVDQIPIEAEADRSWAGQVPCLVSGLLTIAEPLTRGQGVSSMLGIQQGTKHSPCWHRTCLLGVGGLPRWLLLLTHRPRPSGDSYTEGWMWLACGGLKQLASLFPPKNHLLSFVFLFYEVF